MITNNTGFSVAKQVEDKEHLEGTIQDKFGIDMADGGQTMKDTKRKTKKLVKKKKSKKKDGSFDMTQS